MLCFTLLAALMVQAAPPQDDAAHKAAADLLKKVEEKVMNAKTLHVEFEASYDKAEIGKIKGSILAGGNGAFLYTYTYEAGRGRTETITLKSDGRTVAGAYPHRTSDYTKWSAAATERCMRKSAVVATWMGATMAYTAGSTPEAAFDECAPQEIHSKGKEKVGEVEAEVVSFTLKLKSGPPGGYSMQMWIDPAKLMILKRSLSVSGMTMTETTPRFDLDAAFPADHFEFQTTAMFLEGRSAQLAASVLLHARFTGRLPKTLEDLSKRPADLPAGVIWPEGGFWIGGAISKDMTFSSDGTHFTVGSIKTPIPPPSPVAAPTDRLRKHFEARIRMQLLRSAADAFQKSTSNAPRAAQDLLRKPDTARFWPDGGWIAGKLPVDPWGDAFVIRTEGSFSVSLSKTRERLLKLADLTPEEKKALDLVARPPLPEKEAAQVRALIQQLGAEKLADRESATREILAKGAGALHLVVDALATEQDPETAARLGLIRNQIKIVKATWESEIKGPRNVIVADAGGGIADNERRAATSLKTLTTAQADFRSNDRDGNRTMDFYVRDVAGLYALKGAVGAATEATAGKEGEEGSIIRLIEPAVAMADATEDRWEYPVLKTPEPMARAGYAFSVLKRYEQGGKGVDYHEGSGRNSDRFGFVAFPADYGMTGRMTFIVNEDNTIWQKDLLGEEVDTFPENPAASGWRRMD